MGSFIEINDTLQITTEQGFPAEILNRDAHVKNPVPLTEVSNKVFPFRGKTSARIFQLDPVRVYLVHNIEGKWLFWGRILIQSLQIEKKLTNGAWKEGDWVTHGTYKIIDIYEPEYQRIFTLREAPADRNFFDQ